MSISNLLRPNDLTLQCGGLLINGQSVTPGGGGNVDNVDKINFIDSNNNNLGLIGLPTSSSSDILLQSENNLIISSKSNNDATIGFLQNGISILNSDLQMNNNNIILNNVVTQDFQVPNKKYVDETVEAAVNGIHPSDNLNLSGDITAKDITATGLYNKENGITTVDVGEYISHGDYNLIKSSNGAAIRGFKGLGNGDQSNEYDGLSFYTSNNGVIDERMLISYDGVVHINNVLDMKLNRISNVVDPSAPQDVATKEYVDNAVPNLPNDLVTESDLTTALNDYVPTSDLSNLTVTNINLTSGSITTAPSSNNDLVNKSYVDSAVSGATPSGNLTLSGDLTAQNITSNNNLVSNTASFSGVLNMNSNKIENVLDPTNDQDVATKKYVDDEVTKQGIIDFDASYSQDTINDIFARTLGTFTTPTTSNNYVIQVMLNINGSVTKGSEVTFGFSNISTSTAIGPVIDIKNYLVHSTSTTEYFTINETFHFTISQNVNFDFVVQLDTSGSTLNLDAAENVILLYPLN